MAKLYTLCRVVSPRVFDRQQIPTMAKNRNKKKNGSNAMAVDSTAASHLPTDEPQAMDESETVATRVSSGGASLRKVKGRTMKRSKNVRKKKAVAKALSRSEKSEEKVSKTESKTLRTKFAKNLYQ